MSESVAIPLGRQRDALIVAEPWLAPLIRAKLRQLVPDPDMRVVTVEVQSKRSGQAATMRDLFHSALSLPRPGTSVLGVGGDASLHKYPLALWPLFGRIYVQRDWALGPELDDWSLNFASPSEEWWLSRKDSAEERGFPWNQRRHGEREFGAWARWAQLPAGHLLLSVLRHEYSVDERTVLASITDSEAQVDREHCPTDPIAEGEVVFRLLKELDSNHRIWSGFRDRPLMRIGEESRHTPLAPWAEAEAAWLRRMMHAAFARECWNPMGLLDRAGKDHSLKVIFCDDQERNVRGFLGSIGAFSANDRSSDRLDDDGGILGYIGAAPKADPRATSGAYRVLLPNRPDADALFQSPDPHRWDEELSGLIESNTVGATEVTFDRDPIFILCDYDLDTSNLGGQSGEPRSLGVPVTGAKLAALAKGHLARRFPGRTISAIAFTGGSSPVIARECIELGCDFVIRKGSAQSRGGGTHVSADVGGLSSLAVWVWSIICHDRFLRCILKKFDDGEPQAVELLESAYKAVVRREIAVPRSLEPRMTEVRDRAVKAIRQLGSSKAGRLF